VKATNEVRCKLWPKQGDAYQTAATELLFGGATRGGKSHFARVALISWCLEIPQLQCTLIRKKFQDILDNHVYGLNSFSDLLQPYVERGEAAVTQKGVSFANGSRIIFKHCQDERQFESAQGIPSNVLFIDEATQLSERLIKTFRAWCTMTQEMKAALPKHLKGRFPRIIYTANPIGVSVGYFRRHFVKARPTGLIEPVDGFMRQYLPSRVDDNPSEDAAATRGRVSGMHDANTAKALIEGDWDAPTGDFFPEWDEERHVIPDFEPPYHWYRYRTFDWGSAEPFCCYWFAVSDGEMFDADFWTVERGILVKRRGQFWFPRGARVVYREWYGCREDDPSKGIGMRNADIAKGILARSPGENEKNLITLTDSYPFPDRGEEGGQTIAKTFSDCGCPLTLGDTSRVTGWAAMRDALIGVQYDLNDEHRDPTLFIQQQCRYARDYIPALPRHENEAKKREDAAEHGEATHACDAIRLGVLATAKPKDAPVPTEEQIHAQISNAVKRGPTFEDAVKMLKKQKAKKSGKRF